MAILGYINKVYNMEIELPIFRREYDGEILRRKAAELDKTRHDAHERAIISVKRLNRYAEKKDLEPSKAMPMTGCRLQNSVRLLSMNFSTTE